MKLLTTTSAVIAVAIAGFMLGALYLYTHSPKLAAINFFMAGFNTCHAIFRFTILKPLERYRNV